MSTRARTMRDPQVMATLAHLGYPVYFATIINK